MNRLNAINLNTDIIKAIFFDFDGVILESNDIKSDVFAKLFCEYGDDIVAKVVAHHKVNGGMSRYDKIRYYVSEYVGKSISQEYEQELLDKFSMLSLSLMYECRFCDGFFEFANRYRDLELFIVSASSQDDLYKIVEYKQIQDMFVDIKGSPISKSENIKNLLQTYNLKSNEVVYIGDSINDYTATKANNILFIGV